MKRRKLIALISLCTLVALGLLIGVGGAVVMRTDFARNAVQTFLASRIHGSVYVGRISGNPLAGVTVDSLAIRDTLGRIVLSTGPITADYDIRDIIDSRIHLRHVTVEHPVVHLRDFGEGNWNYKMLKSNGPSATTRRATSAFGRFIVLDSIFARNASFLLSMPWSPDDTLRGAVRDSVIRAQLARTDRKIERSAETRTGLTRTYTWTRATALVSHARIKDPDSTGQVFHIDDLDVNEFDPPFRFRNVRGTVRRLGDSVWFDVRHFDLPASTGSGSGKLVWGSNLPMRYDVVVRGDSVSLNDINWVYATLPKTGGGRMVLRISNKRNVHVMDYHIDSMNVRSTGSHLVGEMTFGVGGGLPLQILNVNLRANPVDFDLIRTLNGKPFPIDWQGQIFGDVRAPGGPVNDFDVTSFRGEWRDAHVRGAVTRMSGSGGLDIQFPAFTAFKDFDLDVQTLDLRSIQYLFPAFPKLQGAIAGTATLDSVWTDVRFSNADVTHRDGPGTPSRFTGSGRVTQGSPFITYDVDLNADPISFDMLRRSFPGLTLRGLAYGPLQIKGQSPDLQIVANLVSAAGRFRYAGNIDIDSLGGYGARGVGEFADVDLSRVLVRDSAPRTTLSGRFNVDVRGTTPSALSGAADIRLGQSIFERIPLDSTSRATVRFENGRVITTDTTYINSPFGRVRAVGALGLPGGTADDSIQVTLAIDSLGQLRPYFTREGQPAGVDSLGGLLTVNGVARGRVDSLLVDGRIHGQRLFIRGLSMDSLRGAFSLADALRNPSGMLAADLWAARLGGLELDSVRTRVSVVDSSRAGFAIDGRSFRGDSLSLSAAGAWNVAAGGTTVRVDSLGLGFGAARWSLEQPATLYTDATTLRIDTLGLRSARGGSIGLAGSAPVNGPIDMRLSASRVPLSDIDRVVGQVQAPLAGFADLSARMVGTREAPVIEARTELDSITLSGVGIGRLIGSARYADDRLSSRAEIFQGGKRVLLATGDSLPLAVRWLSYDTLPGRVRVSAVADSADFTLIQAFVEEVSSVSGKVSGNLSIDGTWRRPNLVADAKLSDGSLRIDTLGIALSRMYGQMRLENDTLVVDSVRANSGGEANNARVRGTVHFRDWALHGFNLAMTMNDFLAYNRLELATIYARTNPGDSVRLHGTLEAGTLEGQLFVDRGAIYLPDPKQAVKRFSILDSAGFLQLAPVKPTLYDRITRNLQTNLIAQIGGEFRLSADYADIPLSGEVRIVPVALTDVASRSEDFISRLAPIGTIQTLGGNYDVQYPPLFSKSFEVQSGGTVTFDRNARWNGLLNVTARRVIRKPGKPDVPIAIDVTGRVLTPSVTPRSEAAFPISNSDLISYIVFDEPGFDLLSGRNRAAFGDALTSIFAPIATSATADLIRRSVFNRLQLDQFQLQTNAVDATGLGGSLLKSTRLTGGEAFGPFFLSLSSGLCTFDKANQQSFTFVEQLGGNFEYRLRSSLTTGARIQFSWEPPTASVVCGGNSTEALGFVPTPAQLSLSYLKFWRW